MAAATGAAGGGASVWPLPDAAARAASGGGRVGGEGGDEGGGESGGGEGDRRMVAGDGAGRVAARATASSAASRATASRAAARAATERASAKEAGVRAVARAAGMPRGGREARRGAGRSRAPRSATAAPRAATALVALARPNRERQWGEVGETLALQERAHEGLLAGGGAGSRGLAREGARAARELQGGQAQAREREAAEGERWRMKEALAVRRTCGCVDEREEVKLQAQQDGPRGDTRVPLLGFCAAGGLGPLGEPRTVLISDTGQHESNTNSTTGDVQPR